MKVKFIKSPTALFSLAYFPGNIVDTKVFKDKDLGKKMIEAGVAEEVKTKKKAD